ncbi:copper amine oxidase N-terminal domain-containing protein [Brevibacillus sp. SYSU BS000544]|uniref:copper amine oxidase N-terminal domain-containing protein n=1 Tax=Brevibacillus sp. SYSU BS000544 TaxID=3416443 RepID=UPI003CE56626
MLKKGSILLLAFLLLLTGCSQEAALVRDSAVASMEKQNYDFKGTLKLTGDFEKAMKDAGEDEQEEALAIISALTSGVTLEGSQRDLKTAKYVITLNDDKVLRDHNMWKGEQKAALELFIADQDVYVKTPIDKKYLSANSMGSADAAIDAEKMKEFQKKLNDLTISFMKKYIAKYGYKLSNAKNLGTTTVELPNGEKVSATHITMTLDAKEILTMLLFTAKDATMNKDVRTFAVDVLMLTNEFYSSIAKDEEEMSFFPPIKERKDAEALVDKGIEGLKAEIDKFEKTSSIDKVLEDAKKEGFESFTMKLDTYITSDKLPVRSTSSMQLSFKDMGSDTQEPLTFGLEADQYSWNWGKATAFTLPTPDQAISVLQIEENPKLIKEFNQDGFFYRILKEAFVRNETGTIVFDLKTNTTELNWETVKDVRPAMANGTAIAPFRFLGETLGGTITYDAKTKMSVLTTAKDKIMVKANSNIAIVNGKEMKLPVAASNVNGTLYVPLVFVSEQLGADVTWLEDEKQAIIYFEKESDFE